MDQVRYAILCSIGKADGNTTCTSRSIKNLACASRAWYSVYKDHKLSIVQPLIQHTDPGVLQAARVAHVIRHGDRNERRGKMPDIISSLRADADHGLPFVGNDRVQKINAHILMAKHHTAICELAGQLSREALHAGIFKGVAMEPSSSEINRFKRVLYYVEIFFLAQEDRLINAGSHDFVEIFEDESVHEWELNVKIFNGMFTSVFSVLEIAQIQCLITMLLKRAVQELHALASNNISLGACFEDLPVSFDDERCGKLLQADIRLLIEHLVKPNQIMAAIWDFRDDHMSWLDDDTGIIKCQAWPMETRAVRDLINDLQFTPPEDDMLTTILDWRPSAYKDPDAGPSRMWQRVFRDSPTEQRSFQLWGYLLWDDQRLSSIEILENPNNTIEDCNLLLRYEDEKAYLASYHLRYELQFTGHVGWFDWKKFRTDFHRREASTPLAYHLRAGNSCAACDRIFLTYIHLEVVSLFLAALRKAMF